MDADGRQESSTSSSLMDAASSLRAAALLSRKRRKVATDTLPRRAPEPSLRLDYGHEESMSPSGQVPPAGTKHVSHPQSGPSSTRKKTPDTEDGQREEGEISDTETSPAPPQQRIRTPTPPPRVSPRASTTRLHRQDTTKTEMLPPSHPPSLRDSDTISPSEPGPSWQDRNYPANELFVLETPTYRLDPSHVRPGLTMTQQEYDTAKDVVLDLLGWGVPPEYLLEHGISRHIIYYVFTELNLRLPDNLDISDLVPYPTPEMLAMLSISESPTAWSFCSSSAAAMPPPTVIPVRDSDATDPADSLMSSPSRSPKVKAEPSSPSPTDLSLHAIEQQRRQELLARKAAIASQRVRQGDREVAIPPDETLRPTAVPTPSVDDFLKTIEPSHSEGSSKHDRHSSHPSLKFGSTESMDVDEPILGLTSVSGDDSTLSASPQSAHTVSSTMPDPIAQTEPDLSAVVPPGSSDDALRSTASRHGLSSLTPSADTVGDPLALRRQSSVDSNGNNSQRRGSKRPVAADFVDSDSRNHGDSYSSNGYTNGGPQLIRRKMGSFAGINMRRCVIELSDSEDDGDVRLRAQIVNANGREYSPAVVTAPTRYPSRPGTTTTPPIAASSGSAGFTAPPPSALLEKEEEIKKMRQLIAEREEMRLRKLAVMSGKSTPVVQPATASTPVPRDSSKQDNDTSSASVRSRDTSSYSLDPEVQASISNVITSGEVARDMSKATVQLLTAKNAVPAANVINVKNDSAASETSTIGSLFRFSAGPTVD
ncbi:hypothetical protein EDC04DRAFT_2669274 [Pisolithus marmoratus]|nr:hypothetical protein EDC04DRAFT_2669274 [Pisolithus marmoratus]